MPRKKTANLPPNEETQELIRQRVEGLRRVYLEKHQEIELHEEARTELHYLKKLAVDTLEKACLNTGVCPQCKASGLLVDKTAVAAATAILDRAGLPPAREVRTTDRPRPVEEIEITRRAVGALVNLDEVEVGLIIAALLVERPDLRDAVERALAGVLLIEGEVVD